MNDKKGSELIMKANTKSSTKVKTPSQEIDAIIKEAEDWKGTKLAQLRAVIKKADPAVLEEVKWKKPSKPEGVPVWSHDGILCVADILKNAVRLTFPKGARIRKPQKFFNTRLDSKTVRAIDFFEGSIVNERALKEIVRAAVELNMAGKKEKAGFPVKLAAPAQRALASAGITDLKKLSKFTEAEIAQLHGMGPNALSKLHDALKADGLSFKQAKKREVRK